MCQILYDREDVKTQNCTRRAHLDIQLDMDPRSSIIFSLPISMPVWSLSTLLLCRLVPQGDLEVPVRSRPLCRFLGPLCLGMIYTLNRGYYRPDRKQTAQIITREPWNSEFWMKKRHFEEDYWIVFSQDLNESSCTRRTMLYLKCALPLKNSFVFVEGCLKLGEAKIEPHILYSALIPFGRYLILKFHVLLFRNGLSPVNAYYIIGVWTWRLYESEVENGIWTPLRGPCVCHFLYSLGEVMGTTKSLACLLHAVHFV
jgi:hypothetical protein